MIPSDLVSRLRVLLNTPLPQVEGVAPVHPDTSEFAPGQRFTAQILNPLPDGTFKALVAGKTVTLSLPQSVKSGDVLELEVKQSTAQTVFARLTEPAAQSLPRPQISTAGQLISQLLTGRQGNPEPAPLNQGAPLLPQPPQKAAELVPVLSRAVTESGMFYESHQAQWVNGQRPLAQLFREPQSQLATATKTAQPETPHAATATPAGNTRESPVTLAAPPAASAEEYAPKAAQTASNTVTTTSASTQGAQINEQSTPAPLPGVPQQLATLVQNQLESLATQIMAWQGQVWPGQTMLWTIENSGQHGSSRGEPDPADTWQTTLRLQLPRLGDVEAQLHVSLVGVAVRIQTPSAATADQLRAGINALSDALAAAGVPLTGSAVIQHEPA